MSHPCVKEAVLNFSWKFGILCYMCCNVAEPQHLNQQRDGVVMICWDWSWYCFTGREDAMCLHGAQRILKDSTRPGHSVFTLLPSGERYRMPEKKMPPDCDAASVLRVWGSLPNSSTLTFFCLCSIKGLGLVFHCLIVCYRMIRKMNLEPWCVGDAVSRWKTGSPFLIDKESQD